MFNLDSDHILVTFIFGDSHSMLKSEFSCAAYVAAITGNLCDTQFPKSVSQKSDI